MRPFLKPNSFGNCGRRVIVAGIFTATEAAPSRCYMQFCSAFYLIGELKFAEF